MAWDLTELAVRELAETRFASRTVVRRTAPAFVPKRTQWLAREAVTRHTTRGACRLTRGESGLPILPARPRPCSLDLYSKKMEAANGSLHC